MRFVLAIGEERKIRITSYEPGRASTRRFFAFCQLPARDSRLPASECLLLYVYCFLPVPRSWRSGEPGNSNTGILRCAQNDGVKGEGIGELRLVIGDWKNRNYELKVLTGGDKSRGPQRRRLALPLKSKGPRYRLARKEKQIPRAGKERRPSE